MPTPLENLRKERELWITCLNGEHQNSIRNQLLQILNNIADFRVINEARLPKYRQLSGPNKSGVSALLHGLLNRSFFPAQLVAIRRLSGENEKSTGEKGVWALIPLIRDIAANRLLLTRENLFAVEGRTYDYVQLEAKERASVPLSVVARNGSVEPTLSRCRHHQLDVLTGTSPENRTLADVVRADVFEKLKSRVTSQCNQIGGYVNKIIAHASTDESRRDFVDPSLTLGQLLAAIKALHETINFISIHLLGGSNFGGVPRPCFDQLEHLDCPLVTTDKLYDLNETWERFSDEVRQWEDFDGETLLREFT